MRVSLKKHRIIPLGKNWAIVWIPFAGYFTPPGLALCSREDGNFFISCWLWRPK